MDSTTGVIEVDFLVLASQPMAVSMLASTDAEVDGALGVLVRRTE